MEIFKKLKNMKNKIINFSEINEKKLVEYIESLDISDQKEIDYTSDYWGHSLTVDTDNPINEDPLIMSCHGFNSGELILGSRKLIPGDTVLLPINEKKIGIYMLLEIEFENDPRDMSKTRIETRERFSTNLLQIILKKDIH